MSAEMEKTTRMANTHPFILTGDEEKAVRALRSSSFPNPTLRQASHTSDWGPVGAVDDYTPHERRCRAAMDRVIAKGLCEERDGRFYSTPLTDSYQTYVQRGRQLTAALGNLDRLAQLARGLEREIAAYHRRLERVVDDAC